MRYATINSAGGETSVQDNKTGETIGTSSLLARVFGYMGIGILVTAAFAFGAGAIFYYLYNSIDENAAFTYFLVALCISIIALLVLSFMGNMFIMRTKKSAWVIYMLFAAFMGVMLSSFTLMGVDFWTIGVTCVLTCAVFGILFLIGYFSKVNLNFLAYFAMALLFGVMFFGLFWMMIYLISGAETFAAGAYTISMIISFVFLAVMLIVVAVDAYNIKRILANGVDNQSIIVYCAYRLYCDFIILFIRLLLIVASIKGRK